MNGLPQRRHDAGLGKHSRMVGANAAPPKMAGCTCGWLGNGAILYFDRACPRGPEHYGWPYGPVQLELW